MRLIANVLAVGCLLATVTLIVLGQVSQRKQMELLRQQDEINKVLLIQQEEINKGSLSQQVGVNLLKDMAQVAVNNSRLRDVLKSNGFTLTVNTNQTTTPSSSK